MLLKANIRFYICIIVFNNHYLSFGFIFASKIQILDYRTLFENYRYAKTY